VKRRSKRSGDAAGARATTFQLAGDRFVLFEWPCRPAPLPAHVVARLTPAEQQVALLALGGATAAQIARRRRTSRHTVNNQLASVFRKLGVGSRWELAAFCRR
jgi:DNA-binding CsgD family transcriptional regulator